MTRAKQTLSIIALLLCSALTAAAYTLRSVSVHDPSVVWDPSSKTYYIFGSHRAVAKSKDLMSWQTVTVRWSTATSSNAANSVAFVTPEVKTVTKGGQEVDFPAFNAKAWATRGNSSYNIDGNLWAPDVIYNKQMKKWCMYMSVNGDAWYSSIVLLTADKINGPYRYQGPVVVSGFYSGTAYKDTDLELELATPVDIVLHHDGTIDGDGIHGTWTTETGTSYVTIMMNNQNYNGVMVMQTLEPTSTTVPCFTALRVASGVTVWGYRYGDHTGIADVTMDRPSADVPYYDLHGRRVSGEPKKGLYIHNGKKYVQ